MHEPPSHDLVRQLTELQLCHPSDLRRARGRVRRLAADLPTFDSVWIDSLVQLRLLTPYQARQFEEGHGDQLRIGSYVAVDELGRSDQGTTLLARRLHRRDRCVVKRKRIENERHAEVGRQMQLVLERSTGFAHPLVVLPNEVMTDHGNELVTVSRFVPGLPLNELLVRRGRFPAAVVFEIGRHLFDGLCALQARTLVHGDIRMSNIRLTESGLAVLVDGGIRQAVHPEVTIHDRLSLEAYDGIAPELIGTGTSPTVSSELYSVGCLLWQLLAGRPPFATADPLAKLAAHQQQPIEDVRVWAPDTPAMLAETIRQLTSKLPQERPRSYDEILQRWGRPTTFGRSRLKQFRRLFDGAVPHFARPNVEQGASYWIWTALMLFAFTGCVALIYDTGLRGELLDVARAMNTAVNSPQQDAITASGNSERSSESVRTSRGSVRLPVPSKEGVILLNERGPYDASSITANIQLTIRGGAGIKPEIVIDDVPLTIAASVVTFENVTIRQRENSEAGLLAKIFSQQLTITNCEFLPIATSTAPPDQAGSSGRAAGCVAWSPLDPTQATAGQIGIVNTAFHGPGNAILFAKSPCQVHLTNVLKTGSGSLITLGSKCQINDLHLKLDHVTLRSSGPLLQLAGEFATVATAEPLVIETNDSVFEVAEADSALIVVVAPHPRADADVAVRVQARDSVVSPKTMLLGTAIALGQAVKELEADEQFDGLSRGGIDFAGSLSRRIADARTAKIHGPRSAAKIDYPGIDPRLLGPSRKTTISSD